MKYNSFLILTFCFICYNQKSNAQERTYNTIQNGTIQKVQFSDIEYKLRFESKNKQHEDALTIGLDMIAAKLIPLLMDGASKLFYNPDNYNKEYFASYSFFDSSGTFKMLNPNSRLVFEQTGKNSLGKKQLINTFIFELGKVNNVEGYHYIGLKEYEIPFSWSKLSSPKNTMNYIIDIRFYYFDSEDKAQEFHMNPFLLDSQKVGNEKVVIENLNFQVIPKMKVLQNIQFRIREINAKTQNWDRYLEHYQSNQDNISKFLIRAINN